MLVRERVMPDFSNRSNEMFTGRRPRAFQFSLCWHGHSRTGAGSVQDLWGKALLQSQNRLCTKSSCPENSLCNSVFLCVSVVCFCSEFINHRDTENTERLHREAHYRDF